MIANKWNEQINEEAGPKLAAPATSFVECTQCGYEPADQYSVKPGRCPKCHGFSWHRVPVPGGLLSAVDYRDGLARQSRQATEPALRAG